jgi:hypothetical protein
VQDTRGAARLRRMAWDLWVGLMRLDSSGDVKPFLFACGLGLPSSFDRPHVFTAHALEESRLAFVRSSHLSTKPPTQPDSRIHIKCPFNQS